MEKHLFLLGAKFEMKLWAMGRGLWALEVSACADDYVVIGADGASPAYVCKLSLTKSRPSPGPTGHPLPEEGKAVAPTAHL